MPRNPKAGKRTGSGNPHRCSVCKHRPGVRKFNRGKNAQEKKAPCNHECHNPPKKESE